MKKKKEFSCKQECGSNCCNFVIIKSIMPKHLKPDLPYFQLRNIGFLEKHLNTQEIEMIMDGAIKKAPNFLLRQAKPLFIRILKAILVEWHFKIPIECEWFNKETQKCKRYEERPNVCKVSGCGQKDSPFSVNNCPYLE